MASNRIISIILLTWILITEKAWGHRGRVTNWLKSGINEMIACQGEPLNIMCNHYEGIRITDGFWGRDNDIDCQVDDPLSTLTHKENCLPIDKDYAFRKLQQSCQDQTSCSVVGSPLFFDTEICPHVKKFIRAKYECRQLSGMWWNAM